MADCDKPVGSGAVSYPCNLPPGHTGPCSARENARSVRLRKEWEAANPRTTYVPQVRPAPAPAAPGALEALGMQGPPKTSVDGLTAVEGRDSRREHPEERRRRLAGEEAQPSIEERLVQNAGGVSTDEMSRLGTHADARYEPYARREEPWRFNHEEHPSIIDQPMDDDYPELTQGERVMQLLVEAQTALNEIARIVSSEG